MERRINSDINIEWTSALETWASLPESSAYSEKINDLIQKTYDMGATLVLKIRPKEIFKNSEARRSMHLDDIKALFRLEDGLLVAKLKSAEGGKYKLFALDDYLVIADNKFGEMVPSAFFMPSEIESFGVK